MLCIYSSMILGRAFLAVVRINDCLRLSNLHIILSCFFFFSSVSSYLSALIFAPLGFILVYNMAVG